MFGTVRTMTNERGETFFVGKDVAKALGYKNPQKALRDHVDEDDRTVNESFTVNGTQPVLINESGLYALILSSKLKEAKAFKRWVTSEVLPQAINAMMKVYRQSVMCDTYGEICRNVVIFYEDIEGTDTRNKTVQRKKKKSNQKKIVRNNKNNKIIEFFRK